jgi:hypothetical protein
LHLVVVVVAPVVVDDELKRAPKKFWVDVVVLEAWVRAARVAC